MKFCATKMHFCDQVFTNVADADRFRDQQAPPELPIIPPQASQGGPSSPRTGQFPGRAVQNPTLVITKTHETSTQQHSPLLSSDG